MGPARVASKILCVAGARPNFMKVAPLVRALRQNASFDVRLVHTGQHYDEKLSRIFFEELEIPRPDIELDVGSGSHAAQTAELMRRFEPVLVREQPHAVLVVGDVNSTIACALVTAKFVRAEPFACSLGTRRRPLVAHVEAGLRSFDRDMPEEINRILTDAISDLLFVSEPSGVSHLKAEGTAAERIHFVGNLMIDTLLSAKDRAMQSDVMRQLDVSEKGYALVTLHRPSNVDDLPALRALVDTLERISHDRPIVFPMHPRTRARLDSAGIVLDPARWKVTDPLGYLDFLKLTACARVVLTDSGGVQEETTVLSVPCITLRENTERPITVSEGTNVLAGRSRDTILAAYDAVMARAPATATRPPLWDGWTAERIGEVLARALVPSREGRDDR